MNDDITPEQLAKARQIALQAQKEGFPPAEIDGYLKEQIGMSFDQVMSPNADDYLRAGAQGLTFGFGDELAGLGAALVPGGRGYKEARDEVRQNAAAASAVAPKHMLAAEMAGSLLPALATGGLGAGARTAGVAAKALRAGALGAAAGAASGLGHSEAEDAAGMAKDVAIGGAAGGVLGGGLSLAGSGLKGGYRFVRDVANPRGAVVREAAQQIPTDAAQTIARQEALAPGTAVLGDLTPEMTAMARGIGADARTGVESRLAAETRHAAIKAAKKGIGPEYDALQRTMPVDPQLQTILKRAGAMPPGPDIDFLTLQRLRTKIGEKLSETRRGSVKGELGQVFGDLTTWLQARIPELSEIDSRYGFLSKRLKAAGKLGTEVTNSSKNYAATRTYGTDAGSIGGSLPQGSRGLTDFLFGLAKPNRADRARAVNALLLSPGDATQTALKEVMAARAKLLAPRNRAVEGLLGALYPEAGEVSGLLLDH